MDISERELLTRHIYDELIASVLRILSRLDLSVTRQSDQLLQVVTHNMHTPVFSTDALLRVSVLVRIKYYYYE